MGGYGSGGGRFASKTSDFRKLDLVDLKRLGMLAPQRRSNLVWLCNGEPDANITVTRLLDALRLEYRVRSGYEDWKPIVDDVPLDITRPAYGGERIWFRCPSCGRRCRILYGGELFRCRKCYGAVYETQYENAWQRQITRACNIRCRLGGDGGIEDVFPPKPKRMRWKTYERLEQEDEIAQNLWATLCMDWLRRK